MPTNFSKLPADRHVTMWLGSSEDPLGVEDVALPTAGELNNTDGSGIVNASPSISWNDLDFGLEASETETEPSLADISTYEDFGASNFGGGISFFQPLDYHDDSNLHSVVYDLTKTPGDMITIAKRIDGATLTTAPAADGDFVSVYRTQISSEANPFNIGESVRRTVGFNSRGDFSHYTIVGDHEIDIAEPSGVYAVGDVGRLRGIVQDRDYTNALQWVSSDTEVIEVTRGGFFRVVGSGAATVTARDREAGTEATVAIQADGS